VLYLTDIFGNALINNKLSVQRSAANSNITNNL
jgi:hypothetical protein